MNYFRAPANLLSNPYLRGDAFLADYRDLYTYQTRVAHWLQATFPETSYTDLQERGDRFLEEVLEILQSHGYDPTRIPSLVHYTFTRPPGEPAQELGGVMITLAAYACTANLNMERCGEAELERVWAKQPAIQAKQASKPSGSALPVPTSIPTNFTRPARRITTARADVQFEYLDGWLLYTCLRTDDSFRSHNYILREFTASNGVTILSKNSPLIISPDRLALHGSFDEFSTKPSLYEVGTLADFTALVNRFEAALTELDAAELPAIIGSGASA